MTDLLPFLSGFAESERTPRGIRPHRLPSDIRRRFPDPQLLAMEAQPSGVRLEFTTSSSTLELDLHPTRPVYIGVTRPRGRLDLVVDRILIASQELQGGDALETDLRTGTTTLVPGDTQTMRFSWAGGEEKTVELWLPHNESVELLALRTTAVVRQVDEGLPLWVHHGSSISHGSNATGPTSIWPAVAARAAGVRLQNLGFGGSALLDPLVAQFMRDSPADILSLKIGINLVNLDAMRVRTFSAALHGFLDILRDGHPTTPILLVTPIFCGLHEDTPGPGALDPAGLAMGVVRFASTGTPGDTALGRLTLDVVRRTLGTVAAQREDPQLTLVDGLSLYGPADAEAQPLPDGLHPDTVTHGNIGARFAPNLHDALPSPDQELRAAVGGVRAARTAG